MSDTDSDYESEIDDYGYDTPDEDATSSQERLRHRSRSRIDRRNNSAYSERSGGQHQQNGRRSRRRHGRRQRQRQRNRRNRRNNQDDSWYFPNEQRENQEQEDNSEQSTRENLVTENQAWVQSLISRQAQPSRPTLSPLTQGNNHTIRWTDSNNTVTITQDRHVNVSNIRNSGNESDRNQNSENERPPLQRQTSRPAARQASRQSQRERVNMSSNPDVNFNLAQQLEDRNRALQQLTQAASQIQLAAAAAAANYAQFISTQNSITGATPPQMWDNSQSWGLWDNRYDSDEDDSLLNVSNSDRRSDRQERRERPTRRERGRSRRQRERRINDPYQVRNRSSNEVHRPQQQNSSHSRRLNDAVSINPSRDNINSSDRTLLPQTPSNHSSQNNQLPENDQIIRNASSTDDNNPFGRFDAAFRRQDERNDWRQRRRRRQDRERRRQMESRRQERRRPAAPDRSNASVREDDSNRDVRASLLAVVPQTIIPIPPPLPPPNWVPPPLHPNEWRGAPQLEQFVPTQLAGNVRNESEYFDSEQENIPPPPPEFAMDYDDPNDYYQDYAEQIEAMLKFYVDPGESSTALGEFLRRVTNGGRVIVSRVRTRVTKQYFRRGDFQVALSDFRNLNPEHARQVPGVGFTGTVNNMYRLTVKQHSSFGKPTFEIRPMNKKVRKKKVHVCYKIRYMSRRDSAPRPPPRSTRLPLVTNV